MSNLENIVNGYIKEISKALCDKFEVTAPDDETTCSRCPFQDECFKGNNALENFIRDTTQKYIERISK